MRTIGLILAAAILILAWRVGRGEGATDDHPPATAIPTAAIPAASNTHAAPAAAAATCQTIGDGFLENSPTFGSAEAAYVHVNYWIPGLDGERDIVLAGGRWQASSAIGGGRYWLYGRGCAEAEVREQVALHQVRRGARDAGWGDPALFTPAG